MWNECCGRCCRSFAPLLPSDKKAELADYRFNCTGTTVQSLIYYQLMANGFAPISTDRKNRPDYFNALEDCAAGLLAVAGHQAPADSGRLRRRHRARSGALSAKEDG